MTVVEAGYGSKRARKQILRKQYDPGGREKYNIDAAPVH
jgi:hypothetical protein